MALAHDKSLVLLCFLLAIATSQAEVTCIDVCVKSSAVSPSATAHEAVAGCMAKCALVESQGKMTDALLTPTTKDYNRAEATTVKEEDKSTEEIISMNDQLKKSNCPTTTARNCYNVCLLSGTRSTCAKLCGCTLTETEAAVEEEEEKLTEEMISLNDQLKKSNCPTTTARNCYNVCLLSGTRSICAKLCGCTLTGTEAAIVREEEEKLEEEKIVLNDQLKKSNCPTTTTRNCYNVCRLSGTSQSTCAKLCGCTLTGSEAAVEEVEKLKKEMISLNDQLKKSNCPTTTARNCYNVCRFAGTSRPTCAKLCGCTLTRKRQLVAKI